MKKDRDIIAPYPIYPPYQGMGPMPYMTGMPMMQNTCSNNTNLEQQISNLEKRVSNLENIINSSNSLNSNYNSSNYQML